jgi:hypothetical protein
VFPLCYNDALLQFPNEALRNRRIRLGESNPNNTYKLGEIQKLNILKYKINQPERESENINLISHYKEQGNEIYVEFKPSTEILKLYEKWENTPGAKDEDAPSPITFKTRQKSPRKLEDPAQAWDQFKSECEMSKLMEKAQELFLKCRENLTAPIRRVVYFPEKFIINENNELDHSECARLWFITKLARKLEANGRKIQISIRQPAWIPANKLKPHDSAADIYEKAGGGRKIRQEEDMELFSHVIGRNTMVISVHPDFCVRDILANMELHRRPRLILCDTILKVSKASANPDDPDTERLFQFEGEYERFEWVNRYDGVEFSDLCLYSRKQNLETV